MLRTGKYEASGNFFLLLFFFFLSCIDSTSEIVKPGRMAAGRMHKKLGFSCRAARAR